MNKLLYASLLLFVKVGFSQSQYPTDYFRSPLDIQLLLSGSFGELRNNHFHTGLDFKTQQKEGLNVYAAADGYVSRIKVSPFGYGKTLYIDHPNGYTTVYAHLQQYQGEIATFVRAAQYEAESFEIEVFPKKDELVVKKGQVIALSGNSGSSSGPHLHFEIRETISELSVNPMFFGFDKWIADSKRPAIHSVLVYPLTEVSSVNGVSNSISINLSLQPNGNYLADPIRAKGKIGFSLSTTDGFDYTYNKNGPFSIETCLNGTRIFSFTADQLAFDEGRFINAYIDYKRFKSSGLRYQRMFMDPVFALRNVAADLSAGVIEVLPNLSENYKIEVSDFVGNKTIVEIPILFDSSTKVYENEPKAKENILKYDIDNLYEEGDYTVSVKPRTFYHNFPLRFAVTNDELEFASDDIAIHSSLYIAYGAANLKPELLSKYFIGSLDGNKLRYNSTKFHNGKLSCFSKNLGKFKIGLDTIPPVVKPFNLTPNKWLSKQQTIIFTVSDNLSGVATYRGTINDKWVLFEYESKEKSLTYQIDDAQLNSGKNDLKLIVTDDLGNSTIFETSFYRKIN